MTQRAAPPTIPPVWCSGCGKRLYYCAIRDNWVDANHRSSHTDYTVAGAVRRPHDTDGVAEPYALKGPAR